MTAKLVVLDVLAATGRADVVVPVRRLVAAARVFGIAERSVRVALARLGAAGMVEAPARGVYRLGPAAVAVNRQVSRWRDVESRMCDWDGGWIGVHFGGIGRGDRPALRRRHRAKRLLGLCDLRPQLAVRPDNMVGGIDGFTERWRELADDGDALVFRLELGATDDRAARGLWDAAALVHEYRRQVSTLETSAARLDTMPRDAAVRESFLLGREAIRTIVLDPLLPEPLVDATERRALVDAMRTYDRLGLRLWFEHLDVGEDAQRRALAFAGA